MTVENWIAIASLFVNVLIFLIGALILPSMKATRDGLSTIGNELHALQIEFSAIKTQMTGIEAVRNNVHHLSDNMQAMGNQIHLIQLDMAKAGLFQSEGHLRMPRPEGGS
jgi:hypothetical protein